ncbi:PREDICTED: basic salivary proline-rich protein 1-like [Corvus brachyrhynchos]|uniref:basic salivary proline-rich protein 1-like n=1 Tax=Corvus brachyrhynchos TaxID=85066 RepID=UPI0008164696|nr:PREDICTED: basic salivary proline-rich protein 1-like [Corvus brachyrhynchos]
MPLVPLRKVPLDIWGCFGADSPGQAMNPSPEMAEGAARHSPGREVSSSDKTEHLQLLLGGEAAQTAPERSRRKRPCSPQTHHWPPGSARLVPAKWAHLGADEPCKGTRQLLLAVLWGRGAGRRRAGRSASLGGGAVTGRCQRRGPYRPLPPPGPYLQLPPRGPYLQLPPRGPYLQLPPRGPYLQLPPRGPYLQLPPRGPYLQLPPRGPYLQLPPRGPYLQLPPRGPYLQLPPRGPYLQLPPRGPYLQLPPRGPYLQLPPRGPYLQLPPRGPYRPPPPPGPRGGQILPAPEFPGRPCKRGAAWKREGEMFNRDKTWRSRGERSIPARQLNPYSTDFRASAKKSRHGVEQAENTLQNQPSLGFGRGNAVSPTLKPVLSSPMLWAAARSPQAGCGWLGNR